MFSRAKTPCFSYHYFEMFPPPFLPRSIPKVEMIIFKGAGNYKGSYIDNSQSTIDFPKI